MICGDSAWPRSTASYQLDVAVDRVRCPLLGAASANIAACAYWAPPAEPRVRITGHGPARGLPVTPSKCGNALVTEYLVSGKRPDDTFCAVIT